MESGILDSLDDLGYPGSLDESTLEKALAGGPKSTEYTEVVAWLSKELKATCSLEEQVNALTNPDDSSSFVLEVSSFLKELVCPYAPLMEGPLSSRLQDKGSRLLLLDFLTTELQAARMIVVNKPELDMGMQVELDETIIAKELKDMLIVLGFTKPPENITPAMLFSKVEKKMQDVIVQAPPHLVGKPLFTGVLSDKQWSQLSDIQAELCHEYTMRREMIIKRLDVTIQSFTWSNQVEDREDRMAQVYVPKRDAITLAPSVGLHHLLAAQEDLTILEKTSSASVRKNTKSLVNKFIMGQVPDRGGRPNEMQAPPPEMPSWQQRQPGPPQGGGGRGGSGGGRGGGGGWGGGRGGGSGGERGASGGYGGRGGRGQSNWTQGGAEYSGGGGGWGGKEDRQYDGYEVRRGGRGGRGGGGRGRGGFERGRGGGGGGGAYDAAGGYGYHTYR